VRCSADGPEAWAIAGQAYRDWKAGKRKDAVPHGPRIVEGTIAAVAACGPRIAVGTLSFSSGKESIRPLRGLRRAGSPP
jgi:hypothetical protein